MKEVEVVGSSNCNAERRHKNPFKQYSLHSKNEIFKKLNAE
jgi:hypothetical protein